jgi:hypothetical protein
MLDEALEQLLNRWSQRTHLRDVEVSAMLSQITNVPADPAAPWITFWQQIGRLVRVEQQLGDLLRPATPLMSNPA